MPAAGAVETGTAAASPPVSVAQAGQTSRPVEVAVAAGARAWIRVIVDGAAVYDGTLAPGDHMTWRARHAVILSAVDGGAFDVTVNGRPAGRLGASNEVVERTFTAEPARAAP